MAYVRSLCLALSCVVLVAACDGSSSQDGDSNDGEGGAGATAGNGASTGDGASTSGGAGDPGGLPLGEEVAGEYNLGPVEWEGSFWNACGPYPAEITTIEGNLLAGLSNEYAADGSQCDACIKIVTALGHETIARVVTYGVTTAPGNIDVSQAAYDVLTEGEYPRTMTWQLVECPDTGPLSFQYQTGANTYWTSLWVRNPRIAVDQLLVKSANHADFTPLERGPDGTFTDAGGFGDGGFTLRVVAIDGSSFEQAFDAFEPGALVTASGNL